MGGVSGVCAGRFHDGALRRAHCSACDLLAIPSRRAHPDVDERALHCTLVSRAAPRSLRSTWNSSGASGQTANKRDRQCAEPLSR